MIKISEHAGQKKTASEGEDISIHIQFWGWCTKTRKKK